MPGDTDTSADTGTDTDRRHAGRSQVPGARCQLTSANCCIDGLFLPVIDCDLASISLPSLLICECIQLAESSPALPSFPSFPFISFPFTVLLFLPSTLSHASLNSASLQLSSNLTLPWLPCTAMHCHALSCTVMHCHALSRTAMHCHARSRTLGHRRAQSLEADQILAVFGCPSSIAHF